MLPQLDQLPDLELSQVTDILDQEIETKQRQLAQEAYAMVCKDFQQLKHAQHELSVVEDRMAQMTNTYLKEITAHRDRERMSSDIAFQALGQRGDHQGGVAGGSVQFFEPLQHISSEMRSLFLSMLEEKLKAIFDFDPSLREKTNKAELARYDNQVLETRVGSYEKLNRNLREEVRELTARLKKTEVESLRHFWELQQSQANLRKVSRELDEAKEAAADAPKEEDHDQVHSQVKFLQEQAQHRARKLSEELTKKDEVIEVLRNQTRVIRRQLSARFPEEAEFHRLSELDTLGECDIEPLAADCGVQTDPEPVRRRRPRDGKVHIPKDEWGEEEALNKALREKADDPQNALFREQYALACKELEVAINVVEQKEDNLDELIEQETRRLLGSSEQVSSIAGFQLAGSEGPTNEPEPEQQSGLDGDQECGDGGGAVVICNGANAVQAQKAVGGTAEEVEESAAHMGSVEGANSGGALSEVKATYGGKAEATAEAQDEAGQQCRLTQQMPARLQPSKSSSKRSSSSTDGDCGGSDADVSEDTQRPAAEAQTVQEQLMHAQLQLETLPALREELETTKEQLEDAESRLALLDTNTEDASALKKELVQQSVARANAESDLTAARAALSVAMSRNKSLEASLAMITEGAAGLSGEEDDLTIGEEMVATRTLQADLAAKFRLREKLFIKKAQLQDVMQENQVLHLSLDEMQREVNDLSKRLRKAIPESEVVTRDLQKVMHKMERVAANGGGAHLRMHKQARLREVEQLSKKNLLGGESAVLGASNQRSSEEHHLADAGGKLEDVLMVTRAGSTEPSPPSPASGQRCPFRKSSDPQLRAPSSDAVMFDPAKDMSASMPLAAFRPKKGGGEERGVTSPQATRELRGIARRQPSCPLRSARAPSPGPLGEQKGRLPIAEVLPSLSARSPTSFSARQGSRPLQEPISPQQALTSRHVGSPTVFSLSARQCSKPIPEPISMESQTSAAAADPASPTRGGNRTPTTLPALSVQPPSLMGTESAPVPGRRRPSPRAASRGTLIMPNLCSEPPDLVAVSVRIRPSADRRPKSKSSEDVG